MVTKLLAISAVLTASSFGAILSYSVVLNGANEAPPNASAGTGTATIVFNTTAHTMQVDVSFSGLTGTTTAAHIHCCTAVASTGTAGVATELPLFTGFPTGVTSGTYSHLFDMTLATNFNPAFITAHGGTVGSAELDLANGGLNAYLNIHTSAVGSGEIRGFLVVTPEPGTLGMAVSAAIAGLALARRKARK